MKNEIIYLLPNFSEHLNKLKLSVSLKFFVDEAKRVGVFQDRADL